MDSNHRSQRQQIYSLPPLAAREPHHSILERVKGIEPSRSAWKAEVLPLNYTRKTFSCVIRKYIPGFRFFKPVFHFFSFFPVSRRNDRVPHPEKSAGNNTRQAECSRQLPGKGFDGTVLCEEKHRLFRAGGPDAGRIIGPLRKKT